MDPNTWNMGNPLVGLQPGGAVFQHTDIETPEALWESVPVWAKHVMHFEGMRLYGVDTVRIARECCRSDDSLVQRFQGIVLLGVFLKVTPFKREVGMSDDELFAKVETPLRYYFGKRGDQVIEDNLAAVRKGFAEVLRRSDEPAFEPLQVAVGRGATRLLNGWRATRPPLPHAD